MQNNTNKEIGHSQIIILSRRIKYDRRKNTVFKIGKRNDTKGAGKGVKSIIKNNPIL